MVITPRTRQLTNVLLDKGLNMDVINYIYDFSHPETTLIENMRQTYIQKIIKEISFSEKYWYEEIRRHHKTTDFNYYKTFINTITAVKYLYTHSCKPVKDVEGDIKHHIEHLISRTNTKNNKKEGTPYIERANCIIALLFLKFFYTIKDNKLNIHFKINKKNEGLMLKKLYGEYDHILAIPDF